jgi:hypothetical protein
MARTFTAGDLRTRVRERADMESSTFVSDAEMLRYISASYAELYDQLVRADPERYLKEETFTGDGTTKDFAVGSDYYGTIRIDYNGTNNERVALRRVYGQEANLFNTSTTGISTGWHPVYNTSAPNTQKIRLLPTPNSGDTYTHSYTVVPADLTTASDTINGVSGWEEYIVIDAAIKCRTKEETPTGDLERALERFTKRLSEMRYQRDAANAGRVINTRGDDREGFIHDLSWWYYY